MSLGDRINVWVDVERAVTAVIHQARTIKLPVVVLGTSPIDAVGDTTTYTGLPLILASLIDNAWRKRNQLAEVTAIENELRDLLAGNREGYLGGLGLHSP